MTALGVNRDTPQIDTTVIPETASIPVAANTIIYAGSMVFSDSAGRAVPGSALSTLIALGVATAQAPNRTTDPSGGAAGAISVNVKRGAFAFDMGGGGDTITIANRMQPCYASDDHTLNLTSNGGTRPWAGTILNVVGTQVTVAVGLSIGGADTDVAANTELLSRSLVLNAASFVAGQGTGADTNGTARRYSLGAALPAGAVVTAHLLRIVTAATGNTTLSAAVGVITPTDDFDTMVTAQDMMTTAGYYAGTLGDAPDSSTLNGQAFYGGGQLTVTVTPDGGSKVSACTVGEFHVTVWYIDGTSI